VEKNCCTYALPQYVEKNIMIRQRKGGYSVTDVRNCGMKHVQLTNLASLHVTTVLIIVTSLMSTPTRLSAHSYPTKWVGVRISHFMKSVL
jgi:hypothetical protein